MENRAGLEWWEGDAPPSAAIFLKKDLEDAEAAKLAAAEGTDGEGGSDVAEGMAVMPMDAPRTCKKHCEQSCNLVTASGFDTCDCRGCERQTTLLDKCNSDQKKYGYECTEAEEQRLDEELKRGEEGDTS